jgi:transcriptional regulator with GAF, ATPase, and Fis domain
VTVPSARDSGARRVPVGRLRDIEAVTDAALSRLDEQSLLRALVERVKKVLKADTAAVLLLDRSAGQLVATAASGIEEEVRQGVRIPLGAGFAGRVAASREPVILSTVDHTTSPSSCSADAREVKRSAVGRMLQIWSCPRARAQKSTAMTVGIAHSDDTGLQTHNINYLLSL